MRLQIINEGVRFECRQCGACCDQPWRTMIEADKAATLDRHDFSKYPQLAGRQFYHPAADGCAGYFDLAKGDGTRCLFLDTDGLCIIHKELGPAAKPQMCRQFPFLSSRTWTDERVTANFGCPSVQSNHGPLMSDQTEDIASTVPTSGREAEPDRPIALAGRQMVSQAEHAAIMNRAVEIFGDDRHTSIWNRFEVLIGFLAEQCDRPLNVDSLENARGAAPLPVRILFAATLQPDTLPADLAGRLGFFGRLSLLPKLMALASMSGVYASRLLGRNVSITDVLQHPIDPDLDPAGEQLLLRYFRSRFWARTLAGTRLSIVGGIHQHILDFNAILFFARAEAAFLGETALSEKRIRRALQVVELHLANQPRLYDQSMRKWFRNQLDNLELARTSLQLMDFVNVTASP